NQTEKPFTQNPLQNRKRLHRLVKRRISDFVATDYAAPERSLLLVWHLKSTNTSALWASTQTALLKSEIATPA
ncbi:MAG TPA: hypothetical protein VGY56_16375, partial [Verrucomicrobiae bacterium]|nr:hypothetical protein [Verrucomicrobiae bacterium]